MKPQAYLIGVKGAGMAGLAQLLKARGYSVSGSDVKDKFFTDGILAQAGVKVRRGFAVKNLPSGKNIWFVSSDAYLAPSAQNAEISKLRERGIAVSSYSEAVAKFFNAKFGIAVCGTHGKTTTAALIAFILEKAGKNPTALIGGEVLNWQSNVRTGKGDYFILEADEYQEQFLRYKPQIITVTNVDYDHPDYFSDSASYRRSFQKFFGNLKPGGKIFHGNKLRSYPIKAIAGTGELKIIGEHNLKNILLARETARNLGVSESVISKALREFKGVRRRLEKLGSYQGNILIDDYAHNPQKVAASLVAVKTAYSKKEISVIFQPHTFTRTARFMKEFASALKSADHIFLLDIYGSAREKQGGVSSDDLIDEIRKTGKIARNLKTIGKATDFCRSGNMPKGVWVAMGAGDVFKIHYKLLHL